MSKMTDKKLLARDSKRDVGGELLQSVSDLLAGRHGRKTTIESLPDGSVRREVEAEKASYSLEIYDWFRHCQNGSEPLLKNLLWQLDSAWSALISGSEVDSLNREVDQLLKQFISAGQYPPLDDVKMAILQNLSDHYRQTVKWASVYAGIAGVEDGRRNTPDARQFIAMALLVLFGVYRPASEEAYNNHVSRKGGAARSSQRQKLKDELYKLIEQEIRSHRKPFNSKKDAANYFATHLNEAAKKLGIQNSGVSMSNTIRTWFSSDDALKGLIKNLISPNPKRKRLSSH